MKNSIAEIKNIVEEINCRLEETEKWISDLKDREMEGNKAEPEKEKKNNKNKIRLMELNDTLKHKKKFTL